MSFSLGCFTKLWFFRLTKKKLVIVRLAARKANSVQLKLEVTKTKLHSKHRQIHS